MNGWEDFDPNAPRCTEQEARRSAQSAISRRFGASFEEYIKAACQYYRGLRVANIEKTPEPMKILRRAPEGCGRFIACFESTAQPDFKGTLRGGRCIVFDAKATQSDRIDYHAVTDDQQKALELHWLLGAACFIVITLNLQAFYRVPWDVWRAMKEIFGHRYMSAADLEAFRVPTKNGVILYLDGMSCMKEGGKKV